MYKSSAHRRSCNAIARKVAALGRRCADGSISETEFTEALLEIEAKQIRPSGLLLSVANSINDWTNVSLKVAGTALPFIMFEFLPATRKFRELEPRCP